MFMQSQQASNSPRGLGPVPTITISYTSRLSQVKHTVLQDSALHAAQKGSSNKLSLHSPQGPT